MRGSKNLAVRTGKGSAIWRILRCATCGEEFSTNRPFSEWPEVFPNASTVVTLVGQIAHCSEIIHVKARSWRLKEAKEREGRKAAARKRR